MCTYFASSISCQHAVLFGQLKGDIVLICPCVSIIHYEFREKNSGHKRKHFCELLLPVHRHLGHTAKSKAVYAAKDLRTVQC